MTQGDCSCAHISGHRLSMNSLPSCCLCVFAAPHALSTELMDHCKSYIMWHCFCSPKYESPTHERHFWKEHRRVSDMSIRPSHCFPVLGTSHSAVSEITYFWRLGWAAGIAVNFFSFSCYLQLYYRGFGSLSEVGEWLNLACGTGMPSCRLNHIH